MKTPTIRWPLTVALLALTLVLALPAQAARVRRGAAIRTETFQITNTTRIAVGTNRSSSLGDLKIGDHISISYVQESGVQLARRIADGVPHKLHAPKTTPTPSAHHRTTTPGLLHAHGVLRAVDLQAGTVTIAHK